MQGLDLKRADIITAGSVLLNALMKMLKKKDLIISNRGIREGSIVDYILEPSAGTELALFQNIPTVISAGSSSQ